MSARAAFASPTRAIPTFQPAGRVFGPSALDTALFRYREARDLVAGYDAMLVPARAALGRANRTRPENRRMAQGAALREINRLRAARRAAVATRDLVERELLALGGAVEPVRTRTAPPLPAGCVAVEDDPDMAAFRGAAA